MERIIERYDNLDGLRTIACLSLIAMHIKANANYTVPLFLNRVLASWTHYVLLFLMISGFGMFCGYYERFKEGVINLEQFYRKRYKKILPFYITLILIDIVIERRVTHIIEGITEATLVFGLLPNNRLDVIGVSWTLGVIFLFYMLFPFFVFLCWNKTRTWITFGMSIIISIFCSAYFFTDKFVLYNFTPRHNFLYCAPFFAGGATIFLYRHTIKEKINRYRWLYFLLCISLCVISYFVPDTIHNIDITVIKYLLIFMMWLMYAISVESFILSNKLVRFVSGMSLEMYLSHMFIFRILEKLNVLYLFGHGLIGLIVTWVFVVCGLIVFIEIWKSLERTFLKDNFGS